MIQKEYTRVSYVSVCSKGVQHVLLFWKKIVFLKSQFNMFCLSQFIFFVSMPERDKKNFLDLKAICFICLCRFSVSLRGFLKKDEPKRIYSYFLRLSWCLMSFVFNMSHFFQWQTHFLDLKTVFPLSPSVLFVSMPQWDKKKHVTLLNEKRIS